LLRAVSFVRQQAQERGNRETEPRRVVFFRRRFAGVRLADRDHRHAETIAVVLVREAVDFVAGAELQLFEVVVMPGRAARDDLQIPDFGFRGDLAAAAGREVALLLHDSQRAFEGPVVEIAGAAELGIVRVAQIAERFVKQVDVRIGDAGAVEVERALFVFRFFAFRRQIAQLGEGVQLFGGRLAIDALLEIGQERLGVVVQVVVQIVLPQQLHGAVAGARSPPTGELERVGQGVRGRRANLDVLRRRAGRQRNEARRREKRKESA